jgi:hypothetical protein
MIQSIFALFIAASSITAVGDPAQADLARICRSGVVYQDLAVEFCEWQISCNKLMPPRATQCDGRMGRWICSCVPMSSDFSGAVEDINGIVLGNIKSGKATSQSSKQTGRKPVKVGQIR